MFNRGMSKVMHQMSANAERAGLARGEALRDSVSYETQGTTYDIDGTGPGLLLQALIRQNLLKAMKRGKANKGAAGIDEMYIAQAAHGAIID
jgi:RNA-directed DNA polymerase